MEAVIGVANLDAIVVSPAVMVKMEFPLEPEMNILSALSSSIPESCEPLRKKKFEFCGLSPLVENPTDMTVPGDVFFMAKNLDM